MATSWSALRTCRAFLFLGSLPVFAGTVFAPRSLATVEGDSFAALTEGFYGSAPITVQLQIAASELAAQGLAVGNVITGVRTRLDGGQPTGPTANIVDPSLTFTMAQAANTIAGMSTTFAANMLNPVVVYNAPYTLPANALPGGNTPNAFGPDIVFSTPYTYQGGDLVFMFTKPAATGATVTLDNATVYAGAGTLYRRLFNTAAQNATVGTLDPGFAILAFDFSTVAPTPVPSSLFLTLIGVGVCVSLITLARILAKTASA
jgi:hypothetical protein